MVHYDFYRLQDAGIMADELRETVHDSSTVTIIEWAGVVDGVLPAERLKITLTSPSETTRTLQLETEGKGYVSILEKLA
jgi:tRNA A37 threonylcarbamoyladenosine biosynthesis protein TsaE